MWNNKLKAVTFSIDDGCESDKRIVEIFDKYGIKGTFNLNSGLLNTTLEMKNRHGEITERIPKICAYDVRETYKNHEIAVHTCKHPNLTEISDERVLWEVEKDRLALEALCGYTIKGMAYPCGGINNDKRVATLIKRNTPIKYARTITSTYSFDLQDNLLQFNPTIYWIETDKLFELAEKFIALKAGTPQLFYIWGHAFELDRGSCISYEKLEKLCAILSNKNDIFYGTNREVLIDELEAFNYEEYKKNDFKVNKDLTLGFEKRQNNT